MKTIELNLPLLDMANNPILKENQAPFLYRDALVRILGEVGVAKQVSGDVKLRAYQLGIKIRESGETISYDDHGDFDFIKNQVLESQSFGAVVIGQLLENLEQTVAPVEPISEGETPEADETPAEEVLEPAA